MYKSKTSSESFIGKSTLLLVLTIVMIMLPTSVDGTLIEAPKIIIYGYAVVVALLFPSFNKKIGIVAFICFLLILIFTLSSKGHVPGFAQFIPLTSFFIIMSLNYKKIRINERVLNAGLITLLSIILLLGYSVLNKNEEVISLLIQYYTFGYQGLAETMYFQGKPILFFISHAIAAIAYTIVFFVAILWGKHTGKKYFYILAVLLIPLIISLQSNTSYLSLFIIFTYLFILLKNKYKVLYLALTAFAIYYFQSEIIQLDLSLDFFLGNSNNGFLSRYDMQGGVYSSAFKHIIDSPFIGTGLLFGADQYKADSGIINELLRGGVIYFLLMKYLMYLAVFERTNKKLLSIITVGFFLVMEIAYAFTLSLRGPVMMLFILIYLSHIYQNKRTAK